MPADRLPAFLFVALIGTIQTITAAVGVQRVSWRRSRAVDYRVVEGAVAADGSASCCAASAGSCRPRRRRSPSPRSRSHRIGLLAERPDDLPIEREVSLRLLRHIASSVRHQQFHDADIVTVRVDAPSTAS